jgi:hypothetical protein
VVGLVEDDYLFLLPAADLRMDPALRPRPVSSVAFAYLGNALQLDQSSGKKFAYAGACNTYVGGRLRWVHWVHSYAVIMAVVTVLISFYQYRRHFLHLRRVLFCVPTFKKHMTLTLLTNVI